MYANSFPIIGEIITIEDQVSYPREDFWQGEQTRFINSLYGKNTGLYETEFFLSKSDIKGLLRARHNDAIKNKDGLLMKM